MSFEFEKRKLYDYLGKSLVQSLKELNAYIAGGTITSLFCNKEINDVDIYFRNKKDAGEFIGRMIDEREWIVSHTNKATAFKYNNIICQAIHFDYFSSPEEIFKKFDFTVCMGVFDFSKEEFVLHEDFLKHNAQRILKFNEHTAYPIISALRVQKYEDKYYRISKPEYIKILLTCMNLKLNNYEELKEQMGGMYGVNYDKLLQPEEEENFDLSRIIERINTLVVSDDYFKKPVVNNLPEDIEDLICKVSGEKIRVVKHNESFYKFQYDDFHYINSKSLKDKDIYELHSLCSIIDKGTKLYKFVEKRGCKYYSFYDPNFEYKLNEIVYPKDKCSNYGIYCGFLKNTNSFTNSCKDNAVLIELEVLDEEDVIDLGNLRLDKALVKREVPRNEYEMYLL